MIRPFLCLLVLSALSVPAYGNEFASPEGTWEISSQDSRYAVERCGEDNTNLCGTLIWLGRGANTPENRQYMNTMIIDHARETGENRWRGTLHLFGHSAAGRITQVDDDTIELNGCAFIFVCRTYTLHRIEG